MPFDGNVKTFEPPLVPVRKHRWAFWQRKTLPLEYDLSGLIRWLETKDPSETYSYCDIDQCALAQFSYAIGRKYHIANNHKLERLACQSRSFGDLLHKAREGKQLSDYITDEGNKFSVRVEYY